MMLIKWLGNGGGGLEVLCAARLRQEALFLDLNCFIDQVLARVALGLQSAPEQDLNQEWIDECLGLALEDLVAQDARRLEVEASEITLGNEDRFFFVDAFGIDEEDASARAIRFNSLAKVVRRAFFAIAIENVEFDDLVGTDWPTPEKLRDDTMTALEVILDKDRNFKRDEI